MIEIHVTSNNLKQITAGRLAEKYNSSGSRVLRYCIDFKHMALNLYKELSAPEISILQNKVDVLIASWDKKFEEFQKKSQIAAGKDSADQMTIEAETKLVSLSGILTHTLKIDDRVNWDSIKDFSHFSKPSNFTELAPFRQRASKPVFGPPIITFWDKIFGRRNTKLTAATMQFERNQAAWQQTDNAYENIYREQLADWAYRKDQFEKTYMEERNQFEQDQAINNAKVDDLESGPINLLRIG